MTLDNLEAMSKFGTRLVLPALACAIVIGLIVGTKQQSLENIGGTSSAEWAIQSDAFTKAELIGETDCPMISYLVSDWPETIAGDVTLKRISGGFFPGTQGLAASVDGKAIISVHSTEKHTVRRHDLRSNSMSDFVEVDINASGVTRLDSDVSGTHLFVVTNYNEPTVTFVNANFNAGRTLTLPNIFNSLVGVATIRSDIAVLPSRSHRAVGFLSAGDTPSLQIASVELDEEIFSTAVPYGVAVIQECLVLNYREDGTLVVGKLSADGVITTDVLDTNLNHPQSMAVHEEKLYVLETGSHSLLVYDFALQNKLRFLLPKGAFRGMVVTQTGDVFVSGQSFGQAEKNVMNFKSVLDENRVGIYQLLDL